MWGAKLLSEPWVRCYRLGGEEANSEVECLVTSLAVMPALGEPISGRFTLWMGKALEVSLVNMCSVVTNYATFLRTFSFLNIHLPFTYC